MGQSAKAPLDGPVVCRRVVIVQPEIPVAEAQGILRAVLIGNAGLAVVPPIFVPGTSDTRFIPNIL